MDDVQSWWEIPCIAHFCSLFRLYFNLIDFDIEELEEALLTDSPEDVASSWLQELIVRLLKGCFNPPQDEITTSNYQMYLRRLFRKKCEEGSTNIKPFENDATFHSLPLRTKVEILYHLCDFRLDNEDVPESLKSLESDSLRVEPLGRDSCGSTYWYFYGTRLYREDYTKSVTTGHKRGNKEGEKPLRKWQVVCYTEEDWQVLTSKFKNFKTVHEKNLHRTLSTDFLPELPRLFAEKERLQRQRMLDQQLRRTARTTSLSDPHQNQRIGETMPSDSHKKHSATDDEDYAKVSEMDDEEAQRQREEQEKADRLLAEELEKEERKAGLRERRGGAATTSIVSSATYTSHTGSSRTQRDDSGGRKSSRSPTKANGSSKNNRQSKKRPLARGRGTNKSLAVSIQNAVLSKGARKVHEDDDEDYEEEDEERLSCDDNDDEEDEGVGRRGRSRRDSDDYRSNSRSSSPIRKKLKKKSTTKRKKEDEEGKMRRSKSKNKDDNDKKKRRLKKDKSRDRSKEKSKSLKDKPVFDVNHGATVSNTSNPAPGMSKTKVKGSVLFSQSEEDVQIGMHKVIESIKNHPDAWPFINPVDEDYAPNYYRVISSPMDLQTMEDKLDNQEYASLDEFIGDFQRVVDNCIKYNGPTSEYTEMVETLQQAFDKAIQRNIVPDESDEEISIEYNNLGLEKKRSRSHSQSLSKSPKKQVKAREHKKENDPRATNKTPKAKLPVKSTKREKSDKKYKSLLKHHRGSRPVGNINAATAEALNDIDKWLEETPKRMEYATSGAAAFDSLRSRILGDDNDREKLNSKHSNNVAGQKRKGSDEVGNSRGHGAEDQETAPPKKKMMKKSEKEEKGKVKGDKSSKKKSLEEERPKKADKDKKHKDKHKHHKHHHSSDNSSRKESPAPSSKKLNGSSGNKGKKVPTVNHNRACSPSDETFEKPALSHSKSFEEKKLNPPLKRGNSLFSTLKATGQVKRMQPVVKSAKFSIFHPDPKIRSSSISEGSKGNGNEGAEGDKPEKKKCLLLNDNSTDQKLSLGTVLSTDAIKLVELKPIVNEDEDEGDNSKSSKAESNDSTQGKDGNKGEENEGEDEMDRKLEPSKGFKPEKCMPNLSAWIKAFGGPSKTPSGSHHSKKPDINESKSKFKVMGRGVGEHGSSEHVRHAGRHHLGPKGIAKGGDGHWNSSQKPGEVVNLTEEIASTETHHKKHRHRKMSTSSLSSQSETGSPHCFNNQDGISTGLGNVVNPPRWVDEQWANAQSQSPSASSHVSSQSPANSPFSPPINSPPHTPQTPPKPVGPVRVGFYQDITSQHSSPEKANDSHSNANSNVASPSTPPTPTNNNGTTTSGRGRGEGKSGYGSYPNPYGSRYAANTPSPNVGPGSNIHSPSPGAKNVESPGNPNSPHSPTVPHPPSNNADYRSPAYAQSNSQSVINVPSGRQSVPAHYRSSLPHHPSPSIPPYPSHYGHPGAGDSRYPESAHGAPSLPPAHSQSPQPPVAHVNQIQAHSQSSHQQHYDRYPPHSYHQVPVTGASSYTQNLTAAHSQRPSSVQPSPYPPNPYASNPRSMYNHPMSTDPAVSRLTISVTSAPSEPMSTITSSRGRSSRSNASLAAEAEPPRSASAAPTMDGKLGHDLNGFQWPHNLASLSQIVNSIPNPMNMANAYRQYDQAMAESMSKYQRGDSSGYTNLTTSSSGNSSKSSTMNPPAAHSQPADKLPSDNERRQSSKAESKSSSRSSSSKSGQPVVPGSAFNFSSLSPADLALYPKEMSEGSLYSASPPSLAHRPDLYPTSTSTFHPSFSSSSRSSAGSVPSPYQIPPFIGSHPSPYQSQTSQPFAHTQAPRGLVDPYQQFFPHGMAGLLPPAGYPYPPGLGFGNRPGWI